jgi:hypothetical protein
MSETDFSLTSYLTALLDFLAVRAADASLSTCASSDWVLDTFFGMTGGSGISSGTFFFFSGTLAFFSALDAPFLGCFDFFSFSRHAFCLQKNGLSVVIKSSNSSYKDKIVRKVQIKENTMRIINGSLIMTIKMELFLLI